MYSLISSIIIFFSNFVGIFCRLLSVVCLFILYVFICLPEMVNKDE